MFSIPQESAASAATPVKSGTQGGLAGVVPGLSANPLAQQQQMQMLIKLLQKGGRR